MHVASKFFVEDSLFSAEAPAPALALGSLIEKSVLSVNDSVKQLKPCALYVNTCFPTLISVSGVFPSDYLLLCATSGYLRAS
jgi:hypothetical protein